MSRSSASEGSRGQVQPLPALLAVLALTLALTAYADVTHSLPTPEEPSPAVPALKRVEAQATTGAILDVEALDPDVARLDGYRANVTIRTAGTRLELGPTPPPSAARATAHVATNSTQSPNGVVSGTLTVEVWPWPAA